MPSEKQETAAISARDVHKTYRQGRLAVEVLKGIDFSVEPGEFVALLGPSGSGKSTLLHVLGLMDEPTRGEIRLEGVRVGALDERAKAGLRNRRLGFVFQFDSMLPEFTLLENVAMPALLGGAALSEVQGRAVELLDRFGLKRLDRRFPVEMSGGERQRAALARALFNRPAVLLADEPTGNLDRANGELVFNSLREAARELRLAVVLVTHNEHAARFASRVLRLADGALSDAPERK